MAVSSFSRNKKTDSHKFLENLAHSIDRMNFPVEYQLEFIDLLESFNSLKRQDALKRLQEVFISEYGTNNIRIKVCRDLLSYSERGRWELGLEKWFADDLLFMYRASAYVKDREGIINKLSKALKEERSLFKSNFVFSMIPPLLVNGVLLGCLLLFHLMIFPVMADIVKIGDVYETAPIAVKYIGDFVTSIYFAYLLAGGIALRVVYVKRRDNWVGTHRDKWSQRFPLIMFRSFQAAKLLHVISMMKTSDMKLLDILKKIEKWVDPYLEYHVKKMIKGISHGKDKKSFFGLGLFSEKQQIRIRAQLEFGGGDYSEALTIAAENANHDAVFLIKKYSKRVQIFLWGTALGLGMLTLKSISSLMLMIDI